MQRRSALRRQSERRSGHRETPIVLGLLWLVWALATGGATVAREVNRADKVGAVVNASEKWAAFWRGCGWGTAIFFGFVLTLVILALVYGWAYCWLEQWRSRRENAPRKPDKENP